jgi:hypothetical protein
MLGLSTHNTIPEYIASLLVKFALKNRTQLPNGWTPRVLVQCGVPYADVWDVLHEMYESQVIGPICELCTCETNSGNTDTAFQHAKWCASCIR